MKSQLETKKSQRKSSQLAQLEIKAELVGFYCFMCPLGTVKSSQNLPKQKKTLIVYLVCCDITAYMGRGYTWKYGTNCTERWPHCEH